MRWLSRVLLLAAIFVASACDGGGDPSPASVSKVVRAAMTKDPPSITLLGKMDINVERLAAQITDSLVQYDAELRLLPRVAESWEWSEDRRTVTFHLRPGVRWHDGRPVTAEDVVFTVGLARDPLVDNRTYLSGFESLESLEALDDRTVRAHYSEAHADSMENWRVPLLPRHLAESGAELLTGSFSKHPVGCGPFRFVHYRPGEEILLEANDDYWDGRPYIDGLAFRFFADQRTAANVLLAGELDIVSVTPDVYVEVLGSDRARHIEGLVYSRLSIWHLRWNLGRPYFDDARVRRALVHALDRKQFSELMQEGMAVVASTSYHPDSPWADPQIRPLEFDPDEARRLLDASGWRDHDGDGVRERNGVPMRFELMIVASTQPLVDHTAAWAQQAWAEIGVDARIEKIEWGLYRERRGAGQFDAMLGSVSTTASPDQWDLYHSAAREGGYNFGGLADPQLDEWLDLGRRTFDPDERREIYLRVQRRLHELQPIGALLHFPVPVLLDRRLEGVHPSLLDHFKTTDGPRVWRWNAAAGGS